MRGKQTRIFHSISWFCNFTPEEKNHRAIRQNGRFSIFFSFVFFFSFFFFLYTLVIHPVKYHGTKYVSRRFILRRGVTVRSEVASHLLSARTRSFAIRNTNVCSGFSKKKKKGRKKKQRCINRGSVTKPTKSRINRESRNLNLNYVHG